MVHHMTWKLIKIENIGYALCNVKIYNTTFDKKFNAYIYTTGSTDVFSDDPILSDSIDLFSSNNRFSDIVLYNETRLLKNILKNVYKNLYGL